MLQRQAEEKKVLSSNYYPPEPIYIPNNENQTPTVVNDLILAPENSRETQWDKRDTKTEDDRRIIMSLLDEERDLDYFSDSETESVKNIVNIEFF